MTNYSAKHWAIKAEKSAKDAESYASGIDLSSYATKSELESSLEGYAPKNSLNTKADADLGNTELADLKNENGTLTWDGKAILTGDTTPAGTILPYGGSTAPAGYLLCNGATISRTTYANLFAKIGTTYGSGDGSTTFNIPNLNDAIILKDSTISVAGNGMTLGLTNGTTNFGAFGIPNVGMDAHTSGYGSNVGIALGTGTGIGQKQASVGVTTDPTKSGLIANISNGVSTRYIIKY